MVFFSLCKCFLNHAESLLHIQSSIRQDTGFYQKHLYTAAFFCIAVHRQYAGNLTAFPELFFRMSFRYAELQFSHKSASFSDFAGNLNRSSHQLYYIFSNRHAKSRSLDFVCRAVFCSCKRIKNRFQIFRRHAIAIIFYFDPDMLKLAGILF